ncbi:Uncharacterized protein PBTT_10504 [Plasmodiophora brassicae]
MGKSDEDRVPTLTGINYLAWAQRMAALLIEKDLEDVNTTLLPFEHPPTGSPAPGDIPWAKKDRRAKAKIELRLLDAILTSARIGVRALEAPL